jgi:arsenate reductase
MLEASGVEFDTVLYLKDPLDRDALRTLVDQLEDPAGDLVRKDSFFKDLGLDAADYEKAGPVVDLLLEHPRLMQRPIVVKGGTALIGRPLDRVEELVS